MADGPKPPKGWLIAALVFFLLAFAGCGGGTLGCASFGNDIQRSVDEGGQTALGESSTFTATGTKGAILSTAVGTTCEGSDSAGNAMSFESPGSNTSGNVSADGESFDLSFIFDTSSDETYTVTCTSPGASDVAGGTGDYLVVPFPGFTSLIVGIGAVAAGGFALVLAVICLIVGLVRRSGWKKRNGSAVTVSTGGQVPPPGGFPPPPGGAAQPGYGTPPAPGYGTPPPPGQVPPAPRQAPPALGRMPPAPGPGPTSPRLVPPAPPAPPTAPPAPPTAPPPPPGQP